MLRDVFWEASWNKKFSPLYKAVTGQEPEISDGSDHKQYARELISEFPEDELIKKWLIFSMEHPGYRPVVHYNHLTIGPLGMRFSRYIREKSILGAPSPMLNIMFFPSSHETRGFPFNRDKTDLVRVFAVLLKNLESKLEALSSDAPQYNTYLESIGAREELLSLIEQFRQNIHQNVNTFEEGLEQNTVIWFYFAISQLSTMLYTDEKVIDLLNQLIAEDSLVVEQERKLRRNVKVTEYGIVKQPRGWQTKPAFELAEDIATIESGGKEFEQRRFREILRDIVTNSPQEYLKELSQNQFELSKELFRNKCIYGFEGLERHQIPGEKARLLLLETYGVKLPSHTGFPYRRDMREYISRLSEFKEKYEQVNEERLIQKTITLLSDGRPYVERYLKEFSFLLSTLIMYCDEIHEKGVESILPPSQPIYAPSSYNQEKDLMELRSKYGEFLQELVPYVDDKMERKIAQYAEGGEIYLTLGDWGQLIKAIVAWLENSEEFKDVFWSALPDDFQEETENRIEEVKAFLEEKSRILNEANHEDVKREIRTNASIRAGAISLLLELDEKLEEMFRYLSGPVFIKEEKDEIDTGLNSYTAEHGLDQSDVTIFGTDIRNTSFTYYAIPLFQEEETELIYPVLVTNLVDIIFI